MGIQKVELLLTSLKGVKQIGKDKWKACCPAHDDSRPSLSIAERDGKVLIFCWAGCGAADVLEAVGLSFSDLYEKGQSKAFIKSDWKFKRAVRDNFIHDAMVIILAGECLCKGIPVHPRDLDEVAAATGRITRMWL